MTLAIHHALRTSERATQFKRATHFIGRFQTAPRLRAGCQPVFELLRQAGSLSYVEWNDGPAMLSVKDIVEMQIDCVARWHREPVDNPYAVDGMVSSLFATACQQHQFNYLLWHEEDIARSRDVTDAKIAEVKRNIDRFNQARNDWIEKIDDWITANLEENSIQSVDGAKLNTETPGSAMDRLSIMALRIYHLDEQLARQDIDQQHLEKVNMRLAICRLQQKDLAKSLEELLDDIYSGVKRHRTYRQMKMYNDPTLNPYLYGSLKFEV